MNKKSPSANRSMDKIIIRDLRLKTIVGIFPHEKESPQEIVLNIELFCDIRKAAKSDNIADTIDYKELKKDIINFVENNSFNLLETIAEGSAKVCLSDKKVAAVRITVDKPGCLTKARSAAVEIFRE